MPRSAATHADDDLAAPRDAALTRKAANAGGGSPLLRQGQFQGRSFTLTDVSRVVNLSRRVTYLMLFRLVLISLVLGATILLSWLSDVDLSAPNSLVLFGIIGTTYLLTIIYSLALTRMADPKRLADIQLLVDLIISTVLVHVTGGAQSAYTFFFPLSIIAAATIRFRAGAVVVAGASIALFSLVCVLGWLDILPSFAGQRIVPSSIGTVEFGRALGLNLAAFAGVAMLAYNLGAQIQQTSASLENQRTKTADLRALHEDIIRCLSSGLVTVDEHGVVVTINGAACEILTTRPEEVIRRPLGDLLPGLEDQIDGFATSVALHRADLTIHRSGKPDLILGISVSPLRDNREQVIGHIINFQDLTELREMEAHMRQAERLAVVGTLAAGIAHEIRNPLAAISGSIELLRADPRTDDDGRALMKIVTREVDRLNALITDLLDYTNPQPRELLQFDLVELVRETLAVFQQDRSFGDISVALSDDSEPGPLDMVADPARIRQVLWNLLRNGAAAAASAVTVDIKRDRQMALLDVCDDGPGIAPDVVDRVFDPFFTTKSQGSGLGLATCHSIVMEQGGDITVDSQPGRCVFRIRLPLDVTEHPSSAAASGGDHLAPDDSHPLYCDHES